MHGGRCNGRGRDVVLAGGEHSAVAGWAQLVGMVTFLRCVAKAISRGVLRGVCNFAQRPIILHPDATWQVLSGPPQILVCVQIGRISTVERSHLQKYKTFHTQGASFYTSIDTSLNILHLSIAWPSSIPRVLLRIYQMPHAPRKRSS